MTTDKVKVVAAIDLGTNLIRMIIGQIYPDGKVIPLEEVKRPTQIGNDTFRMGKISVETIHQTCDILNNFVQLMKDYAVEYYEIVSTTGIREADNREYIIEQIRARTGLRVRIISTAEERFLTFKAIRQTIENPHKLRNEGVMIIDIGSGSIEVSVYQGGNLKYTRLIKVGPLRLWKTLGGLEQETTDFPQIIEEYIESKIYIIKDEIEKLGLKHFIGMGGEIRAITRKCLDQELEGNINLLPVDALENLYHHLKGMTAEQIVKEFGLDYGRARKLYPSVVILNQFLKATEATEVIAPSVSLRHGLLVNLADRWFDTLRRSDFINDIISSVRYIGERYRVDQVHSSQVEKLALSIFDQTEEIHSLDNNERLYLQVAAILHDVGKYITQTNYEKFSYDIIQSEDIMGFSFREIDIIANLVKYHNSQVPRFFHESYRILKGGDQLVVSKLAAILKLAKVLDISHKQKITDVKIEMEGKDIIFNPDSTTMEYLFLERNFFEEKAEFFEEVMGYKPKFNG